MVMSRGSHLMSAPVALASCNVAWSERWTNGFEEALFARRIRFSHQLTGTWPLCPNDHM